MRKSLVSIAVIALLVLGGVGNAADKKTLVFLANGASDFWNAAEAGVKKAQGELPDYTLTFKYPEQSSAENQIRLMDDLIAAGVAGIVVSAVDPKTMGGELDRTGKQVALFTTGSDTPKSGRIAYIGSSNTDAGKQAGQIALGAMPNGGKCIGFVGLPGADDARERIEGFRETIKGSKIELVDVAADDMDQSRAKLNVEATLTKDPDINCMVGNTPRIYEALKEAGKLGKITIIGFDEDPITLGGVKEGTIAGTVVQQPYVWGYESMKTMARYLDGDKSAIPASGLMIIPTTTIDKRNVGAFLKALKGEDEWSIVPGCSKCSCSEPTCKSCPGRCP